MINELQDILNKNSIKVYNIYEEYRESAEIFFVKRNLDLTRSKEVKEIRLRVYHDFEEDNTMYRGSCDIYIYPGMEKDEIEKAVISAYNSAKHVKNPYFELPKGEIKDAGAPDTELKNMSLTESAFAMAAALYEGEHSSKNAFINSAEIFSEKKTVRIITSAGCDVTYTKYNINGEFVVQCKNEKNDVEQYQSFDYDDLCTSLLTEKCAQALKMVEDRAVAVPAPTDLSEYPVILTEQSVGELLDFYLCRGNAAYIYPKYSPYCEGYDTQKDSTGEKLNLTLIPKTPYSEEGVPMKELAFIEDGIVKNLHGSVALSSYIGINQAGTYSAVNCKNGTETLEEITGRPYIMVKNFSDFQIDPLDGYFGGEFRLAYLYDGKETSILTGGTVSGNIFDACKKLTFSKERYEDGDYSGPYAVRIDI